jgi:antitoxin FitA
MTLTLRNVPEVLHERLKARARTNRRSLNQEVLAVFERVLSPEEPSREAEAARLLREIEEDRAQMGGFLTAKQIDAARREGRR